MNQDRVDRPIELENLIYKLSIKLSDSIKTLRYWQILRALNMGVVRLTFNVIYSFVTTMSLVFILGHTFTQPIIDTMLYSNGMVDMCTKSFNCYYRYYYCWVCLLGYWLLLLLSLFSLHMKKWKSKKLNWIKRWLRQRNTHGKEESWKSIEEKNKATHGLTITTILYVLQSIPNARIQRCAS